MTLKNLLALQILTFIFIALTLSCEDDMGGSNMNAGDPSNLTVDVLVADDNSGLVTIQAQADNASMYEFDMGTSNNDIGSSIDGSFEFIYENTGNYTIETKAFGSSGRFVKNEKQISVVSGDPSTTGEGYITPITYEGWDLVWNDEFDSNVLDQSSWSYQNGNGCPDLCGWGNNELEYYLPENSWIDNGLLTIEARNETYQNNQYTSTKLITQGKQAFTYGRVDVRAKLPSGQGLWPAIWMLGTNITSVGWPSCGEIDIMEMIGGTEREKITHGTAHWRNEFGDKDESPGSKTLETGLDESFHVFSIIWNQSKIEWLIDDVSFHTLDITTAGKEAFHKPFYMIMNVAVGGNWPGNPNATTQFPTQMQVDYVRVFQEQ